MNLNQQAKNVAAQGRYGDSMLMHVNPEEVRGLSQVMPLTINPETGQPEAFLPFLAAILGSMLGPSLFASLGMTTLSSTLASALGAGLAQTAVTGDLKEGLKTGLTAGLVGSALKGIKGLSGATDVATGATEAATAGATPSIDLELFSTSPQSALQSAGVSTSPNMFTDLMAGGPGTSAYQEAIKAGATGIDAPLSGLYNFASSPTGLVGAIGLGSASMAEQQKVFEEEMARREEEDE